MITVGDETSIGWTMSFIASVLLPLLVFDARREARLLAATFLVVGALVGVYLLGEMLVGFSPLYGPIEAMLGAGAEEELEFSVYRARAGFAHPLFAAAFLSIPAAMGVGMWLMSGRLLPLVAAGLSGAGVLATVSRGSLAAVAVAVAFGILFAPVFIGWKNVARWMQLVVLTAVAGVVALNFGPLVERTESMESQISADVRERALVIALRAADASGWLGTGAGTSGETGRLYDTIVIENSMLQLLMSIGAPGLLLFLLFIGALIWAAWRHRNLAVILGIIAYVVSISSFNSLDAVRSMHVVLGFLVIMAINRADHEESRSRANADRARGTRLLPIEPPIRMPAGGGSYAVAGPCNSAAVRPRARRARPARPGGTPLRRSTPARTGRGRARRSPSARRRLRARAGAPSVRASASPGATRMP